MRQQRRKTTRGKTGYPTYSGFLKNHAWEVWDASGASCSYPSRGQQPHRQQDQLLGAGQSWAPAPPVLPAPRTGQLGLQSSRGCPSRNCQGSSVKAQRLEPCCPPGTSGSVPASLLLRSACPPALKVWSKDRKTWKELQELSLFSLSTVYINNFIRNRSLTSVFRFSKDNSCS